MTPERPLYWHQGLFLQPQHFQLLDQYQRSLVLPAQNFLQPFFWGVRHLEFNEAALSTRVVEVTRFEALFQDGTWIVLGKNARISPRSFEDREDAFVEEAEFPVYIALPRFNPAGGNVRLADEQGQGRYLSDPDPQEVEDFYQEGPPAEVSFLDHHLEILWEDEVAERADASVLRIASLRMRGEEVRGSSAFIPPLFMVRASETLMRQLKQVRDHVQSRCRILETYKPTVNQTIREMEPVSLHYLSALKTLNRYLALLHHHLETPQVHPWDMFGILRMLIAELSTFSDRMNALAQLRDGMDLLPPYDHQRLGHCFSEAGRIISELLDGIVIGSENIITLLRSGDMFSCEIPLETLGNRGIYCLMVRCAGDGEQIVKSMIRHAKAGHCGAMDVLLSRALGGIPMEYRAIPPLGMARRPDSFCFELDTGHPRWEEMNADGRFCVFWDEAPEDTAMELVITRI